MCPNFHMAYSHMSCNQVPQSCRVHKLAKHGKTCLADAGHQLNKYFALRIAPAWFLLITLLKHANDVEELLQSLNKALRGWLTACNSHYLCILLSHFLRRYAFGSIFNKMPVLFHYHCNSSTIMASSQ